MKSAEQQLKEWVADAIDFDDGNGRRILTRAEFTQAVSVYPLPPQACLPYHRLSDITDIVMRAVQEAVKTLEK